MIFNIQASAFNSEALNAVVHYESQWQVATSPTFDPDTITEDTWFTALNLTEFEFEVIGAVPFLYVRVRFRDSLGMVSEFSEPLVISPIAEQRRTLEEAWAFVLDGHIFYVLNFTLEASLIYDVVTGQWYRWYSDVALGEGADPFWNMFRGFVWKGRVLAADIETPDIWEMDPHSMLDQEEIPIRRVVTGFLPLRGSASARQGSMRVVARKENAAVPATLSMRFSDDNGKTWSAPRTVQLAANSITQRLEFRSLGRIRAPGRLWEIEDSGGFVRIEGADADLEGS